jgi:hypothetical protein
MLELLTQLVRNSEGNRERPQRREKKNGNRNDKKPRRQGEKEESRPGVPHAEFRGSQENKKKIKRAFNTLFIDEIAEKVRKDFSTNRKINFVAATSYYEKGSLKESFNMDRNREAAVEKITSF